MAFSRNSMVATVAGSLSLAVLTGCPSAPTQPVGTPTPAAGATATPAPGATATPATGATATPAPGATPSAGATPTTPASAPAPTGKVTIVSGNVYDEASATVDGAVVKVTSLDASVPYTASTTTSAGSYVVNNVPEGANVEIVVSKDGWTSRRRVGSFQTQANQKNEVNFGGTGTLANGGSDPGQAYFISKYPEITAVEPAYDASNVDPATVSYKLTLSEALDDVNRRRFEDAIRLFPANNYAAPENDGTATAPTIATPNANPAGAPYTIGSDTFYFNLKDKKIDPTKTLAQNGNADRPVDPNPNSYTTPYTGSNGLPMSHPQTSLNAASGSPTVDIPWDYAIKKGTLFLDDSTTRATVTWNADNTQATLTFNAPLVADRTNNAKYQVGLVTTSANDKIVDKDNNQLGMDATGSLQSYPAKLGALIHATVRQPDLALNGADTSAKRWVATHQDAALFSVKVDNVDPKLVSVAYTKNLGVDSRFEFTFSEPMAAYNGRTGGHVHTSISSGDFIKSLAVAVSDRAGGTKNVSLKGNTSNFILASDLNLNTFGTTSTAGLEKELTLMTSAGTLALPVASYTGTLAAAEAGGTKRYFVQIDPRNPKTVFLYITNVTNIFGTAITEMKVRVEGIGDPAGNTIKAGDADAQQIQGSI